MFTRKCQWIAACTGLMVFGMLGAPPLLAQTQSDAGPFTAWELAQDAEVVSFQGKQALRLGSGTATLDEAAFRDGTVEFEMWITDLRAFVYFQFRRAADGAGLEEFYFRTHKNMLPDAIQYSSVDNFMGTWQLHHGPGKTAATELRTGRWIPVKVVIKDAQAAVFVGETKPGSEPDLIVSQLAREPAAGGIGLRGFIARGSQAEFTGYFADVVVSPGRFDFEFPRAQVPALPPGMVTRFGVSPLFVPQAQQADKLLYDSLEQIPEDARKASQVAETDAGGLLNLGRILRRPRGARPWAAVASLDLFVERAGRHLVDLGYSDALSVFLNGELLFQADDSYSFDVPRRQGLIGLHQGTLNLPLRAGSNRLELVVVDVFGGWGVMARVRDPEVKVSPPAVRPSN